MANTLGGFNLEVIAQEALTTLLPKLPQTSIFATDFSNYVATEGETVTTRIAGTFTAVDFNPSVGYAPQAGTSTGISVVMNKHKEVTIEMTEKEVASYSLERIRDLFMVPMAHAILRSFYDEAFAKITVANYANEAFNGALNTFDHTKVADITTQMSIDNLQDDRNLMLTPVIYGNLVKDPVVAQAFSIGTTDVLRESRIGRLHGLDIYETNILPTNGEGLKGFACTPEAMLIVSRVPSAPTSGGGEVTNVTDPATGFTFQLRFWFDWNMGKYKLTATWMLGSAVGNADCLYRIVED
jgi:hypothetical protein